MFKNITAFILWCFPLSVNVDTGNITNIERNCYFGSVGSVNKISKIWDITRIVFGSRVQLTNIIVLIHGFPLINQFSAGACLTFFSRGAQFKIRLPWNNSRPAYNWVPARQSPATQTSPCGFHSSNLSLKSTFSPKTIPLVPLESQFNPPRVGSSPFSKFP